MLKNAIPPFKAAPATVDLACATDGELLERFVSSRDEAAFAALARRHGAMVLRVCQRILHSPHDAEDAFQATFVVLARKAGAIGRRELLANWLFGVAQRVAREAKRRVDRRAGREHAAASFALEEHVQGTAPEPGASELRAVVDEELQRLPVKYRRPVVLCYLEGKTNDEAALQLGTTRGQVAGTLARARDLLRERLSRRGLALSTATLTAWLVQEATAAAATVSLPAQAVQAGSASTTTGGLAHVVLKAMAWSKFKVWGALLLASIVAVPAILSLLPREKPPAWQFRARWPMHAQNIQSLAFSADGKTLASAGIDAVKLCDPNTGLVRHTLKTPQVTIGTITNGGSDTVAVDPKSQNVAVGCIDGKVRFYNVATGLETRAFSYAEKARPKVLAFAPDGKTLHAVDHAGIVHIWDLATAKETTYPAPLSGRGSAAFHADGKALAWVQHLTNNVLLLDLANGTNRVVVSDHGLGYPTTCRLAFAPDGQTAAIANHTTVKLYDLPAWRERATLASPARLMQVQGLVFSADSQTLAASGATTVILWDPATGREKATLRDCPNWAHSVAFAPDGKTLAAGSGDGQLVVWNVANE